MSNTAKVLWFDDRNGTGIIEDEHGNEYYVNYANIPNADELTTGQLVEYVRNQSVSDVYCATITSILTKV